jgi:hypothetical protein
MHAADQSSLFSRTALRYEVASSVLGAMISHYADLIGRERSRPDGKSDLIAIFLQRQAEYRDKRDSLDPGNATAIEDVIQQVGPLARTAFAPTTPVNEQERRAQFAQVNASFKLEELTMDEDDLTLQGRIIAGELTADEAVAFLRWQAAQRARKA